MALSHELISQFAKLVTGTKKTSAETTVYGEVKEDVNGNKYVQIDGSDQLTPIKDDNRPSVDLTTANVNTGDRVSVLIKDHTATITGNVSSPAARNDDVKDLEKKIVDFDIVIAEKIQANEAYFKKLLADEVSAGKLTVAEATVVSLIATEAELEELIAGNITVTNLVSTKLDVEVAEALFANIQNLSATNAVIDNLVADYGDFKTLSAKKFEAQDAAIAGKLSANEAEVKYANIDFANITRATIEAFFTKAGMIENLIIGDSTITGALVGVTIKGDLIEAGTVKADKLVVKGSNGIFYKLNVEAGGISAEKAPDDGLHGSVIVAKSITAEKVNVHDLVAFGATIGHFHIDGDENSEVTEVWLAQLDTDVDGYDFGGFFSEGEDADFTVTYVSDDGYRIECGDYYVEGSLSIVPSVGDVLRVRDEDGWMQLYILQDPGGSIYSGVKSSVDNTAEGIYMDSTGQFNVGNSSNYLKFFKDQNGDWKLEVRSDSIHLSSGKTVEETISEEVNSVQIGGRNLLLNSSFKENINEWETVGDVIGEQNAVSGHQVVRADDVSDKGPATVQLSSKNLLDLSSIMGKTVTANGGTLSCGADGGITGSGVVTGYMGFDAFNLYLPKGKYILSASGTFSNISCVVIIRDANAAALKEGGVVVSGGGFSFNTEDYPSYNYITVIIKRNNNVEMSGTAYFQIEKGSTASEYTPFIPLEGLVGSTVTVGGKNLYDTTYRAGNTSVYNGWLLRDENSKWNGFVDIDTIPDVFTLSTKIICDDYGTQNGATTLRLYFYDADKNSLSIKVGTNATKENPKSVVVFNKATVPSGTKYVELLIRINSAGYNTDTQIELGTTATEHEPYKDPRTYTADENGLVTIDTPYSPATTVMTNSGIYLDMSYRLIGNEFSEKYGKPCLWLKHYTLDKGKSLHQSVAGKLEPDTQYTLSGWLLAENVTEGSTNFGLTLHHQGVSGEERLDYIMAMSANGYDWNFISEEGRYVVDTSEYDPDTQDSYVTFKDGSHCSFWNLNDFSIGAGDTIYWDGYAIYNVYNDSFSYGSIPFEVNAAVGSWKYVSLTFTTDSNSTNPASEDIYIHTQDLIGDVYICDLKLEKGNRATDWTPAPEDMSTVTDLNDTNKALSDTSGKLDSAMSVIEDVKGSVSDLDERLTGDISGIQSDITTIKQDAQLYVKNGEVVAEVTKQIANGVGKVVTEVNKYAFTDDGLIVDKTNAETKTQITENGMTVYKKLGEESDPVLVANSSGVDAKDLRANTYLIIGSRSRFENYGTNRTACFWIGE